MKIYTKTGDDGSTSLFRGGRVLKNNQRLIAYGTVDELNAVIGLAVSHIIAEDIRDILLKIQNLLFTLGSDLATVADKENPRYVRTEADSIEFLEQTIDSIDKKLPGLQSFILPGGTKGASFLHFARTICRRAEREVVSLSQNEEVNENIVIFLNRLSDLLFVLSRYENKVNNKPEPIWTK